MAYVCTNCGHKRGGKLSICPSCMQANTFVKEEKQSKTTAKSKKQDAPVLGGLHARLMRLNAISMQDEHRIQSAYGELDRVLGGGIVPGSVVLIGGNPGMGKSTLLGAIAGHYANHNGNVLYASAEESVTQIKGRTDRLGVNSENFWLVFETNIERILDEHMTESNADFLIIDSINTIFSTDSASSSGSPSQISICAEKLRNYAKSNNVTIFVISHVTKEGEIAGPSNLQHQVDTVLYLEGDQHNMFRILRSQKNRFGTGGEVGVFSMQSDGLHEVANPSEAFLAERLNDSPGSSVCITVEGNRSIGVEIQCLTINTDNYNPSRRSNGFDKNRLFQLAAVCDKFVQGVNLSDIDILVNVVGGLNVFEPAADMSLLLALISSFSNKPVPTDIVAIGEVGLTGEIRNVPQLELRLREAANLGFSRVIIAPQNQKLKVPKGIKLIEKKTVDEAIGFIYN